MEAAIRVWPCGASATCSLRSSNRGEKDVEAGATLSNSVATASVSGSRSGCITSRVHGFTTLEVSGLPQFQFPVWPITQSRAKCEMQTVTRAEMDAEHQNISDSASALRCHIHFIKTSASFANCVNGGGGKAESWKCAKLRQQQTRSLIR